MSSYISRFGLSVFALATLASSARASSISAIYAFGDSLSDAGNAYIATGGAEPAPPYVNGEFSNGPVWVQDVAKSLGLPSVTPSLAGGTDYAVGSAISGNLPFVSAGAADLPAQLAAFHATNPIANPTGLYTIWVGSNDLNAILATSPTAAQAAADVAAVINNIDTAVGTLASEGAKNFLVLTVPDLGKTPAAIATGPLGIAAASALSGEFDLGLEQSLGILAGEDPVLSIDVLDTYSLVDAIVANPAQFGLTDVTDPCLTGEVNYAGGTPCSNPNQYLFWDTEHPTAAGQAIVAAAALQTLAPEPATWGLLGIGGVAFFAARRRSARAGKLKV
jgi:phospholipase/lecithinase/hemolysin